MNSQLLRVSGLGLGFLLVFVTGYWLSRSGKPYGALIFTIHKLIAIAAAVSLLVIIYRLNKAAPLSPAELTAAIVSGVFFIVTVASGGWVSAADCAPGAVVIVHHVTPFLTLLATAATWYLVSTR